MKIKFLMILALTSALSFVNAQDSARWDEFIEHMHEKGNGKIPQPFSMVKLLTENYLKEPSLILDIGSEKGKNAAHLIKNGHQVILLDISPKAIYYSQENLMREGLSHGVLDSLITRVEDLPHFPQKFQAIVGTYAFSFIQPSEFEEVMISKIFNSTEVSGYFAGGFFGDQHGWAHDSSLTFVSLETLKELFNSNGFDILEIDEKVSEASTVLDGIVKFHTIHLIAQKRYDTL